jgi:hypothetical protein
MLRARRAFSLIAILVLAGSQGAFAACVAARIEGKNERIILQNNCDKYVSWALCVRISERSFDDYPVGVVAPKGISEYGLFVSHDARVSVKMDQCDVKGCKVIQPRCVDPPPDVTKTTATPPPPPVRHCPKDMTIWPSSTSGAAEHNKLVEMCKVAFPDLAPNNSIKGGQPNQIRPIKPQPRNFQMEQQQARQAEEQRRRNRQQLQNSLILGLGAAAKALSQQPSASVPIAPTGYAQPAASGQFVCRDRRQYDACIPQYISRGLPYGYEGRDIRQVAHEYCARNFCQ